MHSQPLSPSSGSDSSRSGSPDTRATTPSSPSDCVEHNRLASTFVAIDGATMSPTTLLSIFEKHESCNRLGLVIGPKLMSSSLQTAWTKQSLDDVEYLVAPIYNPPESQNACLSTDLTQAAHHYLISLASLRAVISVPISEGNTLHILEKPTFSYPPHSHTISHSFATSDDGTTGNIPTVDDWKTLWANWDLITLKMIPSSMLHQKPIDLRHKCLFYIGHIPTFLDMLISKSIGGKPTEPSYFWNVFERGIDPHVDDPDHCHNHSDVPEKDEDWPTLEAIVSFRDGVRRRLLALYDDLTTGKRVLTRNIARMLVMTHEHEGFHVETLLYMLIQKAGAGTLPPPGFTAPAWSLLSAQWASTPAPSTPAVLIPRTTVTLGHNDSEAEDVLADRNPNQGVRGHTFGWDNESPARQVEVAPFRAEWRCVTNGEFEKFWRGMQGKVAMPASWVEEGGELKVRTMYGPISMSVAQHWPVLTSYDDLVAYAQSKGGRLPTEPELRLFLDLYDVGHEGGANVGFRHWHPVPGTTGLDMYDGKGSNGGVWEWTTTTFDTHEGFVPTKLFTGYSEDFFDTKHQVSLGASYATIPRLGARRTVRNFYQHNYPYPWIGARVVYDA